MNGTVKRFMIWVITLAALFIGWRFVKESVGSTHEKTITLAEMQNDTDSGKIAEITVIGSQVTGKYKGGDETFHTTIPPDYVDLAKLHEWLNHGVTVSFRDSSAGH